MKSTNLFFLFLFGLIAYWIYQNRKRIGDLQAAQAEDQKLFQFDQPGVTIINATTAAAEEPETTPVLISNPVQAEPTTPFDYAAYYQNLINS